MRSVCKLCTDEELYIKAVGMVIEQHMPSASWLQRSLEIGYSKAAIIMARMEHEGIVGPMDEQGRREILMLKPNQTAHTLERSE